MRDLRVSRRLLHELREMLHAELFLFGPHRAVRVCVAGDEAAASACFAATAPETVWPRCIPPTERVLWVPCGDGRGLHLVAPLAPPGGASPSRGWLVSGPTANDAVSPVVAEAALRLCAIAADEMRRFADERAADLTPEAAADLPEIVGASAAIESARAEIRRAIAAPYPVLIEGETGTGKDLAAWCIHHQGPRRDGSYVVVNCAAMPETLLESTLFGHRKGAFTGAVRDAPGLLVAARGGTIFLDEVAELSLAAQAKLLRAIETGEVLPVGATRTERTDARILAATNVDLQQAARERRFRPDLLYRLRVLSVHMPPLRERAGDIPLLVARGLGQVRERLSRLLLGVTDEAMAALVAASWPGNVRELLHEIERAALRSEGTHIRLEDLSASLRETASGEDDRAGGFLARGRAVAENWERDRLEAALVAAGWNVARAARELGVSRRMLFNRIKRFGLERPRGK